MNIYIEELITGILGGSISLLGISATLIALIPVLVEVVRLRSPDFFSSELSKQQLQRGLKVIGLTVWIFGSSTVLSMVSLILHSSIFTIATLFMFLIGLILLSFVSNMLIKLASSYL